jgi:uncharacterized protein (UPF0332 family)
MNGRDFLGTASLLATDRQNEAAFRSAVSRAYYACFLSARVIVFDNCDKRILGKDGITNERGIRHKPIQNYLKDSNNPEIRMIGEDLSGLSGNRNDADYNMSTRIILDDAKDALENAEHFLTSLDGLNSNEIGRSVEEYLRKIYPQ